MVFFLGKNQFKGPLLYTETQKITLVYIGLGQTWKRKQISIHDLKSIEKKISIFLIFQIILLIEVNTHESYNLV